MTRNQQQPKENDIDITIRRDLDYDYLIGKVSINGKFVGLITNEASIELDILES